MLYWSPIDADDMKKIPGSVVNKDDKPAIPVKVHGKTYYFTPYEAIDIPHVSDTRFKQLSARWGTSIKEIVRGSEEEKLWVDYRASGKITTAEDKPEVIIKAVFPSKKVLERLNKDDLFEIAECAGLELNPATSKDDLVMALEAART